MNRVEHGLLSMYVRYGCKCPQCVAASRDYARARTRARAYGQIPQLVDVGTVRVHLCRLAEHGIGEAQVAALSGIGRSTITRILRPRGPRRGVTGRVAAAILGVDPSWDNAAATARVDATGTRRLGLVRLDRVLAAGTVTAATARAVRAFFDTHWDHPPAASTRLGRRAVTLARARATRRGFLPALAWDDDTIDDPSTIPDPAAVRPRPSSRRVHLEDVEMLARLGATWPEVQARTGLRPAACENACARAGRRDLAARITCNRRVAA